MNKRQLVWAEKWQDKIKNIQTDVYALERKDVEEIRFSVKRKAGFIRNESETITLHSTVAKTALIDILNNELEKAKNFFEVVKELDFYEYRCSHKSGNSNCTERDCDCCNCTFDFSDYDVEKILLDRRPYLYKKKE